MLIVRIFACLYVGLLSFAEIAGNEGNIYLARANLSTTQGKGIGYKKGYSTLEGFLMTSRFKCDSFYPFFDLRLHGMDNLKLAMNAGAGTRYLTKSMWIFGINTYYDTRQGSHRGFNRVGNPFQQVGVGLEALSPYVDFRLNFYIPVGRKLWKFEQITYNDNAGVIPIYHKKWQSTMQGFNAEVGGSLGRWNLCECFDFSSYLAAGPYYFDQHKGSGRLGGQVRLTSVFARYFLFELKGSYDHISNGTFQIKGGIEFPIYPTSSKRGKKSCPEPCYADGFWPSLIEMIAQPIMRMEIMPFNPAS